MKWVFGMIDGSFHFFSIGIGRVHIVTMETMQRPS